MKRLLILIFFIVGSCADDPIENDNLIEDENVSPDDFSVSVLQIGNTYAVIEWNQPHDYDKNKLTHSIYLEGDKVGEVSKDSLIRFLDLTPNTNYSGRVEVTDSFGGSIVKEFSFKTKVINPLITFDRLITEFDNGNRAAGYSIITTKDKGFIVAGEAGFNFYQEGIYLAKFDSLGFEEWHTVTESQFSDDVIYGMTLFQTSDEGYMLCKGNHIAKFDPFGFLTWQNYSANFKTVIELVTGEFLALVNGGTVVKFDSGGQILWTKPYDPAEFTQGKNMILSGDGNVIILEISGNYYDYDITVRKMNSDGELIWTKVYANDKANFPIEIVPINEGYMVLANTVDPAYSAKYGRLIKIDSDGNLIWDKEYGNGFTQLMGLEETSDGNVTVVGTEGNYSSIALHLKFDPSGNSIWRREYFPSTLDYNWLLKDVKETSDGGLILLGGKGFTWYDSPEKQRGMWLVKTDDQGLIVQ